MTKLKRFGAIEKSRAMRDLLAVGQDKRKARRLLRGVERADPGGPAWLKGGHGLSGSFIWEDTKQGHEFWKKLDNQRRLH